MGARFKTRFVMDVLCDEDAPLFLRVLEGLRLLEDDALGGGGSRGSGRGRALCAAATGGVAAGGAAGG
jgi:CRISPR-associated protein Csm3